MLNNELTCHILRQIQQSSEIILERFKPVNLVEDFTGSPYGMEKFDSICMLLITIGESLKKLDKVTDGSFLSQYPQVDWKKVKGLRDIITHQYFDVNAEAIFDICESKLPELKQIIDRMVHDIDH
jgi:uncharacterized protein with HEPN domain